MKFVLLINVLVIFPFYSCCVEAFELKKNKQSHLSDRIFQLINGKSFIEQIKSFGVATELRLRGDIFSVNECDTSGVGTTQPKFVLGFDSVKGLTGGQVMASLLKQNYRKHYQKLGTALSDFNIAVNKYEANRHNDTSNLLTQLLIYSGPWYIENEKLKPAKMHTDEPFFAVLTGGVTVSQNGQVIWHLPTNSTILLNGNCIKSYPGERAGSEGEMHSVAVSIAQSYGAELFHFYSGDLLRLLPVLDLLQEHEHVIVHVAKRLPWVMDTLKLFGISDERIVAGALRTETLLLPPPTSCGNVPLPLLKHMHKLWRNYFTVSAAENILPTHNENQNISTLPKCLVIRRRVYRRLSTNSYNRLLNAVSQGVEWSMNNSGHSCEIVIIDDNTVANIPIKDQMEIFSRAILIVGIHGAGLIKLIAAPRTVSIIELLPQKPNDSTDSIRTCYLNIAVQLGMKYTAIILPPQEPSSPPWKWEILETKSVVEATIEALEQDPKNNTVSKNCST